MAVFTSVTQEDVIAFLASYSLGTFRNYNGIVAGVENSNFLLETTTGRYILTIFEHRTDASALPFCIALMEYLTARNIPCPAPIKDKNGNALKQLAGKPALIVSFLEGSENTNITPTSCFAAGAFLASFHQAGAAFPQQRPNPFSLLGWKKIANLIAPEHQILPLLKQSLSAEIDFLQHHWPAPQQLPSGAIHADLFPDNLFFQEQQVSGVIDFYFACTDFWAYDIAICFNAWCFDNKENPVYNHQKATSFLKGYESIRVLSNVEKQALPVLCRGAALRFLLTRLHDWHLPQTEAIIVRKNPAEYVAKLGFFQENQLKL